MQTTYALLEPFSYNRGYRRLIAGVTPAAGANYTHTVPGDAWERLIAIQFLLTTSSTTADRLVTIDYAPKGGSVFLSDGAAVLVEASSTQTFNGSNDRGQSEWNTGTSVFFPLWGGFLESGWTFSIHVGAIDTTDQISAINLLVEKFEVGSEGYVVGGTSTEAYAEWRAEHYLP